MNEETIEFDIEFLSQKLSENPQSPLFARLADYFLYKEQTVEALSLCREGLKRYPDYFAGHVVLGKIHTALKEYSKAKSAYTAANRLCPFNQSVTPLLRLLPSLPDESERTTDENYFAPNSADHAVQSSALEADPAAGMVSDEELTYTLPADSSFGQPAFQSPAYAPDSSSGRFPPFDEYAAQNKDRTDAASSMTLDEYLSLSSPSESQPVAAESAVEMQTETISMERDEIASAVVETPTELTLEAETPGTEAMNVVEAQQVLEQPALEPAAVMEEAQLEESPVNAETPIEQNMTAEESEPAKVQDSEEPEMVFTSPEQAQLFAEETAVADDTPAPAEPTIDDLAERLQNVERLVPQENYRPAEPPPAEESQSQSFESEMVTPTLAEIYASQGEFTAAIQAYEILMFTQPGKTAEFQQRVKELQQLKLEKDGTI